MRDEKHIMTQDFLTTNEKFKIIEDKETRVLKTTPTPKEEDLPSYYSSEAYASHQERANTPVLWAYMRVRKIAMKSKIKLISTFSTKTGALLDFGCGLGGFLSATHAKGWTSYGIEPHQKAKTKAKKISGREVYSTIGEAQKTNKKYDVITLWHSLEHVVDLGKTIRFLYNSTKKEGKVVVAVPNHQSFDAKHYKNFWAAYDTPRHVWHFDQKSITNVFKKHGFSLERKHLMMWDAFYISILSEKNKRSRAIYFKAAVIGIISNFLSLFTGESSSITYVFSKRNNT
ncbi:MAG: class I SAM-dependent methyltransferase [Flavobacteriaceae bacterium]|jgi:2-polyprenyl-3-methyl-5-hydroxy-6-metoxy-1,4-benzoquinol methylase|nr:class I SAM-dependent methyltransferase [Flavobacteriaceae bacterium]